MTNRRFLAISAGAAVSLSTMALPSTALAADTHIPPLPLTATAGAKKACATAKVSFRESVARARGVRSAARRQAQVNYHSATIDDMSTLAAQLESANNPTARRRAIATFRTATAADREDRRAAAKSARLQFKRAFAIALQQRRSALATCR